MHIKPLVINKHLFKHHFLTKLWSKKNDDAQLLAFLLHFLFGVIKITTTISKTYKNQRPNAVQNL